MSKEEKIDLQATSRPCFFDVIFAIGSRGQFGYDGGMPWGRIKEDLEYFAQITKDTGLSEAEKSSNPNIRNAIIMGRGTFESIRSKPLPGRLNVVISSKLTIEDPNVLVARGLNDALESLQILISQRKISKVFVIGGVALIKEALDHPWREQVYVSLIELSDGTQMKADKWLETPWCSSSLVVVGKELATNVTDIVGKKYQLIVQRYASARDFAHPEHTYLDFIRRVIKDGTRVVTRTGIDCIGLLHEHISFDLDPFPLITTRRVFWRGIVEEDLFFLTGKTQSKILSDKGVKIWEDNTSREFLNKRGMSKHEEGEMGDGYGFQWRHFGAERHPNEQLELGQGGVDQISNLVANIKTVIANPTAEVARRLIVSAWNPAALNTTALPPCHYSMNFSVRGDKLSCLVIMRSSDTVVGLPWNIAQYALLTYMIAHVTGLGVGKISFSLADAHVYANCLDEVKKQFSRMPRAFPRLRIIGKYKSMDEFHSGSFKLEGYYPHPRLKFDMAI
jgi:dihydrofolate reductase / thymidylate synthase